MTAETQMPRYRCHKRVWALKIADLLNPADVGTEGDGSLIMVPAGAVYAPIRLDAAFVQKHNPEVGGYFVVYEDGYKSYSPAAAFESGYSLIRENPDEA